MRPYNDYVIQCRSFYCLVLFIVWYCSNLSCASDTTAAKSSRGPPPSRTHPYMSHVAVSDQRDYRRGRRRQRVVITPPRRSVPRCIVVHLVVTDQREHQRHFLFIDLVVLTLLLTLLTLGGGRVLGRRRVRRQRGRVQVCGDGRGDGRCGRGSGELLLRGIRCRRRPFGIWEGGGGRDVGGGRNLGGRRLRLRREGGEEGASGQRSEGQVCIRAISSKKFSSKKIRLTLR